MDEIQSLKSLNRHLSTTLPKVWIGYFVVVALLVIGQAEVAIDPATEGKASLLDALIALVGYIYWLFCVYRVHKVIAEASNFSHPITPGKAVGYHFIPFYNLYWIFKWTNETANFVNGRLPSKRIAKGWAGFFLLIGALLGGIDLIITLAVYFSVAVYLTRKIRRAIELSPSPNTA